MPISDKYKLIFVHIPKNAGTSITNYLEMQDIGHHKWNYYYYRYPDKWKEYKKISIIRNPWDRVVSCYEYSKMENSYWHSINGNGIAGKHLDYDLLKDLTFEECLYILKHKPKQLKHQGWANQIKYISKDNQIMVDHIIKIDDINKELSTILDKKIEIPIINKSHSNNYHDYYINENMINIVKDFYFMDIKVFNFKF